MAKITLVTATDPRILLESAADGFLVRRQATPDTPFPSPDYLLALRQGGIRDDLVALAAERGIPGWFDPPLCVFNELPEVLGLPERRPLDDFERDILITEILRDLGGRVFSSDRSAERFAEQVSRFFGELVGEGVNPKAFGEACGKVDGRDEFETMRDAELADAYRAYLERLNIANCRDGRDTWAECASVVEGDPEGFAERLGGRREMRLFGLNDLRRGWRVLLRALRASPALDSILIYAGQAVDLGLDLPHEHVELEEPESIATRLFSDSQGDADEFDLLEAPDAYREAEYVAGRVRQLAEQGVPLHRIGIIARKSRPYTGLVLDALRRLGVPATARQRVSMQEIPVVRAILGLVRAAANGWSRHGLAEVAEQPFFRQELRPRVVNYVGFRKRVEGLDAWEREFEALLQQSTRFYADDEDEARDRQDNRGNPPPRPERVAQALERLRTLAKHVGTLSGQRPLNHWLEWLTTFLTHDPLGLEKAVYEIPQDRFDLARVDLAGLRGVKQIAAEWKAAVTTWGGGGGEKTLGITSFADLMEENLSGDAVVWTTVHRGVQVVEGFAALYRSFDVSFLVGAQADAFPARPQRSAIFTDAERDALVNAGLPLDPADRRDRRERGLFRSLVAGARQRLVVSYPERDVAGRDVIRSAFVEELIDVATAHSVDDAELPKVPLAMTAAVVQHAERMALIERTRETGVLSPYNGLIEDPELVAGLAERFGDDHRWSPTKLESYAKCPWAFFSGRILGLDKEQDPDRGMDARMRGTILHDALQRFFDAACAKQVDPVYLRDEDLPWAEPALLDALDAAIAERRGRKWLGHPELLAAKREEMARYLRGYLCAEVQEHEDTFNTRKRNAPKLVRTGVVAHEEAFTGVVLERDGIRIKYSGFIDRVERGVDERVDSERFVAAVDYKASIYSAPGMSDPKAAWPEGVVLQVPLYAHALEQTRPDSVVSRVEYWGVKQGEPVHRLALWEVDRKSGTVNVSDTAQQKMDEALNAVARHVKAVRGGEFSADPPSSCGCPSFCHAYDICRIAGGPRDAFAWRRK